jgi:hypothetical protein
MWLYPVETGFKNINNQYGKSDEEQSARES